METAGAQKNVSGPSCAHVECYPQGVASVHLCLQSALGQRYLRTGIKWPPNQQKLSREGLSQIDENCVGAGSFPLANNDVLYLRLRGLEI